MNDKKVTICEGAGFVEYVITDGQTLLAHVLIDQEDSAERMTEVFNALGIEDVKYEEAY